jgi:hypothetical protein
MRHHEAFESEFTEDVSEQAGWMYADLFLAMMVLFLATISFVPQLTKLPQNSSQSSAATVAVGKQFDRGANQIYATFDPATIQADLTSFENKQSYPPNSTVLYAQVIGGYNPKTQSANDGAVAAIGFSIKLKSSMPAVFGATNFDASGSSQIPVGSVVLRMTFIPPIATNK